MSQKLICPECKHVLASDDINISTNLAKCSACGHISRVSELLTKSTETPRTTPPLGSDINVLEKTPDTLEIIMPPKGFSAGDIPQLIFTMFFLGFISFWTWGASQGSVFFALFSLPFWFVGLSMLIGLINGFNEIQSITLTHDQLLLHKKRPLMPRRYEYKLTEIEDICLTTAKQNAFSFFGQSRTFIRSSFNRNATMEFPAILTGKGTVYFFENANEAESAWLLKLLQYHLHREHQQTLQAKK